MTSKFWLVFLGLILCGCANDPVSTTSTNNKDIQLELLFEYDGVKIYRFYDNGSFIYYADARGRVSKGTAHAGVNTVE